MFHKSVLTREAVEQLNLRPDDNVIDGTVGGGGHAEAILDLTAPKGQLIGCDLDPAAVAETKQRLERYGDRVHLFQENFRNIHSIYVEQFPHLPIRGFLLDLGLSSFELSDRTRGFSFLTPDAPLDMRFGQPNDRSGRRRSRKERTAADILNTATRDELYNILSEYGQETNSNHLADEIVRQRQKQKFETVGDLAAAVLRVYTYKLHSHTKQPRVGKRHPATKVFQALRIAVNDELASLAAVMPSALTILQPGSRLAIITFHSLEDRLVKEYFRRESRDCICPPETPICVCGHRAQIRLVTKKPITPTPAEIRENPRSRSAQLRVVEKI
ncbi:MAG: 16S rRNA (cytosine(1402)-N(4))-methyltransferase RsmH [Patescibacteria group bacterium]